MQGHAHILDAILEGCHCLKTFIFQLCMPAHFCILLHQVHHRLFSPLNIFSQAPRCIIYLQAISYLAF